uniref:Uncharacterized protein n=1 Tax=Oryza rufipogon TaxID=4529 RepID=A0A0E0QDR5_ORYRU
MAGEGAIEVELAIEVAGEAVGRRGFSGDGYGRWYCHLERSSLGWSDTVNNSVVGGLITNKCTSKFIWGSSRFLELLPSC